MIEPKQGSYWTLQRPDLLSLIEEQVTNVLDVGCAAGMNASIYRQMGAKRIVGVELNPEIAQRARERFDEVIVGSIEDENLPLSAGHFDLIVCGDVLEHLANPWKTLAYLWRLASSRGKLLVSIPNVRFARVIYQLVVAGDFPYAPVGVLDRTHLRFFTRKSFAHALLDSKWRPLRWSKTPFNLKQRILNALTLGMFRDFLTPQHYVVAEKAEDR